MPAGTPPLAVGLAAAFLAGMLAGAVVNWAVYWLAWNRRSISPWSPAPTGGPARGPLDRVPVLGWLALRREREIHGARFWIRPLVVELLLGAAWAALYWWEVDQYGLLMEQARSLSLGPPKVGPPVNDAYILVTAFVAHALLFSLMTAASLIDVDEKTIPDGVTVPGTLLAFVLAAVAPNSLLPHVSMQNNPSLISTQLLFTPSDEQVLAGFMPYLEPLTLTAPGEWPPALQGLPHWQGLAIGVGCYLLWIVAIAPGEMRLGRGFGTGLRLVAARKCRALAMRPLAPLALIGAAVIAAVWALGGAAWAALLSALVGALGGGALVWSVRIVATAAMRREAMGFGDVTLMMMIGAFVGWQTTLLIFFLAPFAALVVGIIQLIVRRDDVIPYGPFLCLAAAAVVVAWAYLWNAEQRVQHIFEMPGLVVAAIAGGVLLLGCVLAIWVRIKEAMFGRRYDEA